LSLFAARILFCTRSLAKLAVLPVNIQLSKIQLLNVRQARHLPALNTRLPAQGNALLRADWLRFVLPVPAPPPEALPVWARPFRRPGFAQDSAVWLRFCNFGRSGCPGFARLSPFGFVFATSAVPASGFRPAFAVWLRFCTLSDPAPAACRRFGFVSHFFVSFGGPG